MPILSGYDRGQLTRIARGQYDVVSRSQALCCGMTRGTIAYRLRTDGPWRQILPGIYLTVTGTATEEQRETAALLYAGPQSVITGPVAVRRHNLRCAGLNVLDVLIPADLRRKSTGYVQIQRTSRMPERFYTSGPLRFTSPATPARANHESGRPRKMPSRVYRSALYTGRSRSERSIRYFS